MPLRVRATVRNGPSRPPRGFYSAGAMRESPAALLLGTTTSRARILQAETIAPSREATVRGAQGSPTRHGASAHTPGCACFVQRRPRANRSARAFAQIRACAAWARRDCFCPRAGAGRATAMATEHASGLPATDLRFATFGVVRIRSGACLIAANARCHDEGAADDFGVARRSSAHWCVSSAMDSPRAESIPSSGRGVGDGFSCARDVFALPASPPAGVLPVGARASKPAPRRGVMTGRSEWIARTTNPHLRAANQLEADPRPLCGCRQRSTPRFARVRPRGSLSGRGASITLPSEPVTTIEAVAPIPATAALAGTSRV